MKTFRTLDQAVEFYKLTDELNIVGHMRDQLSRAASSIALNLSEGNAKFSVKEKKRYYKMAYGSVKECKTIFKLINNTDTVIEQKADHLAASLYKLINSEITAIQDSEYC